jgi:hypothetical protein
MILDDLKIIHAAFAVASKFYPIPSVIATIEQVPMRYPEQIFIGGISMVAANITAKVMYDLLKKNSPGIQRGLKHLEANINPELKNILQNIMTASDKMLGRSGNLWALMDASKLLTVAILAHTNPDYAGHHAELDRWIRPTIYLTTHLLVLSNYLLNERIPRNRLGTLEEAAPLVQNVNSTHITCSPLHHSLNFLGKEALGDFGFTYFLLSVLEGLTPQSVTPIEGVYPFIKIALSIIVPLFLAGIKYCATPQETSLPTLSINPQAFPEPPETESYGCSC